MLISSRKTRLLATALAAVLVGIAAAGLASAQNTPVKAPPSKNCARAIVNDWYPDGDVDFLYPLDCYQKAIKSLSGDLQVYSSATEDINRAYLFAKRSQPDPGRGGTKTTSTESTATTTDTATDTEPTTDTGFGGTSGGGAGGLGQDGGGTPGGPSAGTSDSSSVPLPLIVLGGLAVLLFAAGGAGYLSRRMRGAPAPEDDPASAP